LGFLPRIFCGFSEADCQMRLDKLVSDRFGLSRRQAQEAVRLGRIDVGGVPCLEPGQDVEAAAPISFWRDRPRPRTVARHLRILYEDRHALIIDKPAGMLTQPTQAAEPGTLLEQAGRYLSRTRGPSRHYVGIVQRLDRDTTGAILVVCSPRALRPFQALFRAHAIEREYDVIVEGCVERTTATIDLPLVADRGDGRRGVARMPGKGANAVTHYEVVERFGKLATRLLCRLETGRTHQIRIHLAEIGHPVIGEPVYRPRNMPPFSVPFERQALHARALGFVHPLTGRPIRVEAPVPSDMAWLLESLK
jgi:23S rRNA pseudouridine1911/1915/1917 synthase